ncbi:MAG: type I-E CRISPR-associated protein Cse2/CasB [Planctomycetes bacterium]|nr:type I-E CRISPR-associated protein Cse2/CasB [Planctomycetota bacterium]
MSPPNEKDKARAPFVAYLESLLEREDRAALAALRRGLGKPPGTAAEMHPYVVPWLGEHTAPWQDAPLYITAALFAQWHQGTTAAADNVPQNLGCSLRECARIDPDRLKSVERRLVALLNCHPDDLHIHLRHAVGLLKSKNVPLNWSQLLYDIKGWGWESRSVQRNWAKGFWATLKDNQHTDAAEDVSADTSDTTDT